MGVLRIIEIYAGMADDFELIETDGFERSN